jgi:hypothetical protein
MTALRTIYLQVDESEVSWCVDQIHDTDVEYVRKDIVDDLLAALKETWTFLEQAPEFPYRLLADAEELQEIVRDAIAKAEGE